MPPRAVLVGLPGAGKSTVGARLARRLGVPFADSDHLVVARDGRSVTEIFGADGEPAFRALESVVILDALTSFDGILALGGGAVTTDAVRAGLADAGVPVVLLAAAHPELVRRIGASRHRPLLADDPAAKLAVLAEARSALYRQVATITVDTAGRTVGAVAAVVVNQLPHSHRDQPSETEKRTST